MGWDGIGTLLGKLSTFVPGRVEQMKNEKARLLDERSKLLDIRPFPSTASDRVDAIDARVSQINTYLGNKATD